MERGALIAGRYELVKRLGRGGMGEVWAGRDRSLHRDVAVKLLALDDTVPPDLPARFEREAVAAAQISHPNVVALHDRGVHEDLLFLVMERVEGTTLAQHIRDKSPMGPARALEIAQEICAALVAAHRAQVIHYDIKPHNVMLTPDGRVKVVDFGIAGFVQAAFTVAHSSQLAPAGTPEYGAPEQFLTERGDERSDLYALGGVLFALLTDRPPFTGHNGIAVMRRKLDEEAPSLDTLRPDLPPAVTELVAELLRRDPDRRPQTAAAVHERLGRLRATLDEPGAPGVSATAVTVPVVPPRTETPPPTRRLSASDGPFEIAWTGRERRADYAPPAPGPLWRGWLALAVVAAVTAASIYYPFAAGKITVGQKQDDNPWMLVILVWVFGGLATLFGVISMLVSTGKVIRHASLLRRKPPWTLHIGPRGITTTDATGATIATGPTGRRTFVWDHLKMVTLENIESPAPYRYAGLHARFTDDAPHPDRARPAGWIYPAPLAPREHGRVPLCVLGPLSDQQHSALIDALTRYAGSRWQPEAEHVDGT
ncbi:serine/threonine-protein kinase [Streptomyces sp. ME19-01-6]|uniref:serine/threonine-protein kinase n=1 Tax=Streptomyces sp. ME19-01-6 TaxID=3028686 RepID=UPI0029AF7C28|nr:serine/threonine-protein kinase [Streptomyces sp. ME19-01-6]MDX3226378.1 serine/threonine-protein kinase [Streptomyces sp. ME19-01-6]